MDIKEGMHFTVYGNYCVICYGRDFDALCPGKPVHERPPRVR